MLARGLNHVSFPVRDLAASLHFYRDVLGLRPVPRPALPVGGAWLEAPGGQQIHLIERFADVDLGAPAPGLNPMGCHTAFRIDDYAAALALLRREGLEVLETSPEAGQMWVRDPDGHLIELISITR